MILKICAFLLTVCLYADNLPPLTIGTSTGYAPYISVNNQGEFEGFDVDVATELAKRLNRQLILKDQGSMPSLMMALRQGKVDALIWGISITEERRKTFSFVHYQGETVTRIPIIFWKEVPDQISSLDDLAKIANTKNNKFVCVEAGTSQEAALKSNPSLNVKYVDKISDALLEIKYGKSIATVLDPSLLPSLMAKNREIKVVEVDLPLDQQVHGVGICLNPSNQELLSEIQNAIREMKDEGVIQKFEKKWNLGVSK